MFRICGLFMCIGLVKISDTEKLDEKCDMFPAAKSINFTNNLLVMFAFFERDLWDSQEKSISNFYECYVRGSSNIKISHQIFDDDCKYSTMKNFPFENTSVRIFVLPELVVLCSESLAKLVESLPNNTTEIVVISTGGSSRHILLSSPSTIGNLEPTRFLLEKGYGFYEVLERIITARDMKKLYLNDSILDPKYVYFYNENNERNDYIGLPIMTVILVVIFFIIGVISCLYSLLSFSLIEEDFRRRNDEREYTAAMRRDQQQTPMIILNNYDSGSTHTALASESRVSNVSTDRTQASENLSGLNSTTICTTITQTSTSDSFFVNTK